MKRNMVEGYWQGLVVEASAVPYVAAKTYGPPENCYPAEGGYCEDGRIVSLDYEADGFIDFLRDDFIPSVPLGEYLRLDFSTLERLFCYIEDKYQTEIEKQIAQDMD